MMKTLASSSAKIFVDKYGEKWFSSSRDVQVRFLRRQKLVDVGFLNLISAQHKPILPVSSSSSESQAELEIAETKSQKKYQSKTVNVRLQLHKQCSFGEQFLIVGDDPMFGLWNPSSAVPLCWSDGHVWMVELDMPIGKLIQFKFILKTITGNISWQPGPDRILRTWATKNTITVVEDWENAELQKITEESIAIQNKEPAFNSDMSIAVENVTHIKDGPLTNAKEEALAEAHEKLVIDDVTQSQEKTMAMVAENITYPKEEPLDNANKVLGTKTVPSPEAISKKDDSMAGNILADNGRAATVKNSGSTEIKENPITYEEGPVLVPGLTPLSMAPTEEATNDRDERSSTMDVSVQAMEAKDHNAPELDDKQEPEGERHMRKVMINDEEKLPANELKEKTHLAKAEEQSKSYGNPFMGNDVQWGRRTLQKLLSSLGFPLA